MGAQPIVVFSHGFGVRSDDKGLLTDIATALPGHRSVLFDYNEVDEAARTLTVPPLAAQAEKLREVLASCRAESPDSAIDLVCHSQGCLVAALAAPRGVRRAVLLTPVFDASPERSLERYAGSADARIDLQGVSEIPPSGGYRRYVPAAHWEGRRGLDTFALYSRLADESRVTIVTANHDQVLAPVDLAPLDPAISVAALDGDHNFSGDARKDLVDAVVQMLER